MGWMEYDPMAHSGRGYDPLLLPFVIFITTLPLRYHLMPSLQSHHYKLVLYHSFFFPHRLSC